MVMKCQAEYRGQVFYHLNKPANWWYSDGQDWYFFKDEENIQVGVKIMQESITM